MKRENDDYKQHSPAWERVERRKRRRVKRQRILAGGIAGVIIIAASIIFLCSGAFYAKEYERGTQAQETDIHIESADAVWDLNVNGISIKGMTREEAKTAIEEAHPWEMTVTYGEDRVNVENLVDSELRSFLDNICTGKEEGEYTFAVKDSEELRSAAAQAVQEIAKKWDVKAKNASISGYDPETDKFLFADGTLGKSVNQEKLVSDLVEAVISGRYDAVIPAEVDDVLPELSAEEARAQYQRLSTFTTETTANEKRNKNVRLAAQAINGTIVQPGEEFSFNKIVGPRTAEKGYQEAAAYNNGEVVQELGGGVCQVSSTMYRVAFQTGMKITYRRSHTFEPNYVTPGQDAAISWDSPDFRFVNTSKVAIGIRASYSDRKMTVSFYGIPVLEDGITWSLESEKVEELPPPDPIYVEDPTLAPGKEVIQKAGTNGSRWVTYKIASKDGTVVEKTEDHSKTYKGHAAVIRRNTAAVKASAGETKVVRETEKETTAEAAVETITETTAENIIEEKPNPDEAEIAESAAPDGSALKRDDLE